MSPGDREDMHASGSLEGLQDLLADPGRVADQQRLIDRADLRGHCLFNKGADPGAEPLRQVARLMQECWILFQLVNMIH